MTPAHKARNKRWKKTHPDKVSAIQKRHREKYPERTKASNRKRTLKEYNLTESDYEKLLVIQNGVCAICRKSDPTGQRLAVDHCHATNKIRGLLCCKCNRGIGFFDDEPMRIRAAADYLEKS